jgi:hypothetical protein
MLKNFPGVKDMTLMGEGWLEFNRIFANIATQAVPFLLGGGGQCSRNMIQITMLTVDMAPKLEFNEGSKSVPG